MNELSVLDFLIMIIVLLGMWRGFKAGLIQSIVSLVGWLIAFFAGTRFAANIAPYYEGMVDSHVLQVALGFLTVVLVIIAVIHVIASMLKKVLSSLNLSFLDKVAGGVLGSVRSILVVLVILSMGAPLLAKLPVWHTSVLAPELLPYAPVAKKLVEEVLGDAWSGLDLDKKTANLEIEKAEPLEKSK